MPIFDGKLVSGTICTGSKAHAYSSQESNVEMPGMRLTPEQVECLCGVDRMTCRVVLDDLVRARFLVAAADGSYARIHDAHISRRAAKG